jgi:hypothetical protein
MIYCGHSKVGIGSMIVGRNYQVQSTTNLASPVWITETNFIATQVSAAITNCMDNSSRKFYRAIGY